MKNHNPNLMKKASSRTYANGKTLQQIKDCKHRGKKIGTKRQGSCARCPGVPINQCAVHGSCILFKYGSKGPETCCTQCTQCEPKG